MRKIIYRTLKFVVSLMMNDQFHCYLNPKWVMPVMFMQYLSLLFPNDQFANQKYDHLLLGFIKDLLTWSTLQRGIYLVNSDVFTRTCFHVIGAIHLTVLIVICLRINLFKGVIQAYFSYLQICLFIPTVLLTRQYYIQMGVEQSGYVLLYIIPLYINYIVLCYISRNYALPTNNPYHRRYSIMNIYVGGIDVIVSICVTLLLEYHYNILIFIQAIIWYIHAFLIVPYETLNNQRYLDYLVVYVVASIIKLTAHQQQDQDQIVYYFLFFIPICVRCNQVFLEFIGASQEIKSESLQQIIRCGDVVNESNVLKIEEQFNYFKVTNRLEVKFDLQLKSRQACIKYQLLQILSMLRDNHSNSNGTNDLVQLEQAYFFYIYYLTFYCEQGLIAYITLKQYQQIFVKQSLYAKIFSKIIIKTIIHQNKCQQLQLVHNSRSQFTIDSIYQSNQFQDKVLIAVQNVMTAKIQFYRKMQHGFSMIEEVQNAAWILSLPIMLVEDLIKSRFQQSAQNILNVLQDVDLVTLKSLSLMYSIVFNDYFTCLELHIRMQNIIQIELGVKTDKLLNRTILDNDVVLIYLSIMKNAGKILNTNRQSLSVFFGYQDAVEFDQIVKIEQLMPLYIAIKHKQLINNYIQRGSSKLLSTGSQVFYLDPDNFMHPATLQLSNIFDHSEDFIMTGMLQKQKDIYNYIIFDEYGYILGTTQEIYTLLTNQTQLHSTYLQSKWLIYFWFDKLWDRIVEKQEQIPTQTIQTCFVNPLKNFDYIINYFNKYGDRTPQQSLATYNRIMDSNVNEETITRTQFNKIAKLDNEVIHQVQYELNQTILDDSIHYVLKIISINQQHEEPSLQLDKLDMSDESIIPEFNINNSPHHRIEGQQRLSQTYMPTLAALNVILETKRSNTDQQLIEEIQMMEIEKSIKQVKLSQSSIALKQHQQLMSSISSSTNSSQQNSIFNIIRYLSNNDATLSQIIKCIIIMSSLAIIIFGLFLGEIMLMRANTNELQYQIPLVRIPNKFNRYYCTFVTIGQIDITSKVTNLTYGNYYNYRLNEEFQKLREEILLLIRDLKLEFSQFDNDQQLKDLQIRVFNEFSFEIKNTSFIQFNQMVNDHSSVLSSYILNHTDNATQTLIHESLQLEFLKANLSVQMIISTQLINRIVQEFFDNIQRFELQYIILLIIKLLIIAFMVIIQYRLWLAPLAYQKEILLLICKSMEEVHQEMLIKESALLALIQQKADQWKHIDYFAQVILNHLTVESQNKIQGQVEALKKNSKAYRIQHSSFKTRPVKLFLAFILWMLAMKVTFCYIFQSSMSNQSLPELQLCMNFVKFTDSLNGLMVLSGLIKSQELLVPQQIESNYFKRNIEMNTSTQYFALLKQELLDRYKEKYDSIVEGYPTIYQNIVSSNKMSDYNKQLLLSLYEQDMCNVLGDQLPFCEYSNGNFTYFPQYPIPREIDNNRDILLYGMNGIVQRVMTIVKSSYSNELNKESANNISDIYDFLQSKEYIEAILPYFFDLNKSFILFYSAIITTSLDILESNYTSIVIFQSCFEIGTLIVLFLFTYWRVRQYRKYIIAVRHCLVLIPQDKLRNPQICSRIKRINNMG